MNSSGSSICTGLLLEIGATGTRAGSSTRGGSARCAGSCGGALAGMLAPHDIAAVGTWGAALLGTPRSAAKPPRAGIVAAGVRGTLNCDRGTPGEDPEEDRRGGAASV